MSARESRGLSRQTGTGMTPVALNQASSRSAGTNRDRTIRGPSTSTLERTATHANSCAVPNLASKRATSPLVSNPKLVFGLNPRANKTKHDEYAEQRLRAKTTTESSRSSLSRGEQVRTNLPTSSDTKATHRVPASVAVVAGAKGLGIDQSRNCLIAATKSGTSSEITTNLKSSSRPSNEQASRMARRKSFDEDLSTVKVERPRESKSSCPETREDNEEVRKEVQHDKQLSISEDAPKKRTQFNIMPPPQVSIAGVGRGSVVGFAKARIYDKPARKIIPATTPIHPNPLDPAWTSPWSSFDEHQPIPKSISSGFKPPKQVNVTKAREKWEDGEPFLRCKSRQRLAAQANKKLFPGTWSMTSVVATQQLHLQQALAQASAKNRSNIQEVDPSVKVLTRGSVLERVQQFERVPNSPVSDGSIPSVDSPSSPTLSSSSLSPSWCSPFNSSDDSSSPSSSSNFKSPSESGKSPIGQLSRSSSISSVSSSSGDNTHEAVITICDKNLTAPLVVDKKAHYKKRVLSVQRQLQLQHRRPVVTIFDDTSQSQTRGSLSSKSMTQQRRPTLSRRSSVQNGLGGSTASFIPKFYNFNSKPNTYEMEVQKRNIVACFENFPDRSAQLDGFNSRRQFQQIALACNFSDYFKIPLILYVKHKLETEPDLFIQLNRSSSTMKRRTSTVALPLSNGLSAVANSNQRQRAIRHARSNSVILDQPLRSLVKANSIDSPNEKAHKERGLSSQIKASNSPCITCDQYLICWRELINNAYDNSARFIHLLTLGRRDYLLPEDFVPLVQSIIDDHPGLKFLRAAPDFHMRYIQTVIARIYFCINKSWTGKITVQEMRKSNLLAVLQVLSQEEDINQVTDYFSYEHFYVIYCKFWTLDQDHDLLISKEDLARHNDAALSSRIIERIFSNVVSKQTYKTGKMNYPDFVWFLIAEEDKKHPRSIEYWFRLMDLDGDGYISMYEMEYFYYEQMKRLELMNIEPLPFLDSACQILDLVNPREKNKISLADLKRTKMATIFFDTFVNLEKYLEHESREFVATRDVVQDGVVLSDWDRYASEEYENLVTEETSV